MTKENKEFIDAYIFMTYENMLKVFENEKLKVILQEECNDPTEFILQHQTSPNRANLNYGFLSFSKSYHSSPMWGHYGDKHRGCCLHFRFPHLKNYQGDLNFGISDRKNDKYYALNFKHDPPSFTDFSTIDSKTGDHLFQYDHTLLWEVKYAEMRVVRKIMLCGYTSINNEITAYRIDDSFITKGKSWEYEQEMRIIIPIYTPSCVHGRYFFIGGFNKFIKSVILGLKCNESPDTTQKRINGLTHEFLRDKMMPIHKAEIHPIKFDIISPEHEDFLKKLKENGE